MEDQSKKKKLITKLKNKYRFIIVNDHTYHEVWQMRLSRLNVFTFFGLLSIIGVAIVFTVIAYTPVRELIPGYDSDLRNKIINNYFRLDSLETELKLRDQYFANINAIISGKVPVSEINDNHPDAVSTEINYHKSKEDSMLRKVIEQEERFSFTTVNNKISSKKITGLHFFPPVKGIVTNSFNANKKHYGVDIVSPPNEVVKATLDGVVTSAHWTLKTGHIIMIQHENNLLSVYKHNAELLKDIGDFVSAGEAIAIVGNSGELTTGPHLHFELWFNRTPLNPELYIPF